MSLLSTSCGSDGTGRPKSISPPGSCSESSSSSSVSNGSPPTRYNAFNNNTFSNGFYSRGASSNNTSFSQPPPSFPTPPNNNNNNNNSCYDRDGSFSGGGSGSGSSRSSSPLSSMQGSPATWNHTEMVQALMQNNDVLIAWMKERNLVAKTWSCPKCTSPMGWEPIPLTSWKTVDRYQWRCPRRSCALTIHIRSSSFFDRPFFVTLASFIEVIYWWAKGAPMAFVVEETGCGMEFLVYAYCLIREVCGTMVNEFVVGGPGAVTGWTDSMKLTINGMVCENYLGTMQVAEKKWRQKFGTQAFQNILEHIATVYDVGGAQNRDWDPGNFPSRGNNAPDWRRENRAKDRVESKPPNDQGRKLKSRGSYGASSDVSSAWKVEVPSLWHTSDSHDNFSLSFNEGRSQNMRSRRS